MFQPVHAPSTKTLALTIAGAAVAGAVVWHFTRELYYAYVPPKYQYRPGTMTGWMANALARHAKRRRSRRPVRVYLDGCFDLMHYGHANALRQAKALGDELVVGLVPDSEILRCKGPPILSDAERLKLVESVKWVDEVLTDVPYDLTPEFLHELFTKHRIDYVLHGDDPCLLPDGTDAYAHAKKLGRFKMIKRTEGVSTTDIVGRMLMCSRDNARFSAEDKERLTLEFSMGNGDTDSDTEPGTPATSRHTTVSRFMPTSRRIVQFSSGKSAPAGARIVYIDGAFDLFHVGHVEILKASKPSNCLLHVVCASWCCSGAPRQGL
jgi:ethanolamine-phosphate cytidylyltransferase